MFQKHLPAHPAVVSHLKPLQPNTRVASYRQDGARAGQQQWQGDSSSSSSSSSSSARNPHHHHQQQQRAYTPRQHQRSSYQQGYQQQQQQHSPIKLMQLEELQQLVHNNSSGDMGAPQLAAVFARAAKLRPPLRAQQRDALLGPVWAGLQGQLPRCKAYEVVLVLWAAAKLGYPDEGLYARTLDYLLEPQVLSGLQPRNLSNLLYAVASAPPAVGAQYAAAAVQAVLPALLFQLDACNAQDLTNVLWALGTLGPSTLEGVLGTEGLQQALQQLLGQLQECLPSATPQGVGNTLWALARLGHASPQALQSDLTRQLLAERARATPHDASSSLWALATLQQQRQQQQQAGRDAQQWEGVNAELQQSVPQLLGVVLAPASGRTNCHSLALALWAVAKLGVQVPPGQLQQLLEACVQHSTAATAQDVANILWGCATMQQAGVGLAVLPQQRAEALLHAAAAGADAAEPQAIANTLWAAAKMGLQVPMGLLKALVKPFTAHVVSGAASPQNIANVVWALATLQAAAELAQQQLLEQRQRQWQQEQQEQTEAVPERVVRVLLSAFMQQLPDSNSQEVCNTLWAAAKLQYCVDSYDLLQAVDHALGLPGHIQPLPLDGWGAAAAAVEAGSSTPHQQPLQQRQQQQRRQQGQLPPSEAANLLWSVATTHQLQKQRQPGDVPLPLPLDRLQLLLSVVLGQVESVGEQELASSLWAAARLEPCMLPEGLLAAGTLGRLAGRVSHMSLQAVANLAYALGQLGAVEAKDLLVLLLQRGLQLTHQLTSRTSSSRHSRHRGSGADAASSIGWGAIEGSSRLHQAIPNLCWSAAVLAVSGQAGLLRDLAAAAAAHCWPQVTPVGASQLYMLHMALQLEQQQQQGNGRGAPSSPPGGLVGCLTQQQLQQCRTAWVSCGSNPQDTVPSQPASPSAAGELPAAAPGFNLQRKVFVAARQLQGLAEQPRYEAPTPDQLFSIDIQAQTVSGVPLAIEVDGPSHFRLPDMALTGPTLFRNRQLAARGYVVVSVPYTGWNAAVEAAHRQQEKGQQQWGQRGEEGQVLAEGLLGVEYLQGLVDAAVLTHQPQDQQLHAVITPPAAAAAVEGAAAAGGRQQQPVRRRRRRTAAG